MITDKGADYSVPMSVIILLPLFRPLSVFHLRGMAITFTQLFQQPCFRNFVLHLHDEYFQFLLALPLVWVYTLRECFLPSATWGE